MRSALRLLCALAAAALPLSGQTETAPEKREAAGRRAWFACLSKPEGLEDPVKVLAGGKLSELALPEFMASDAVKIPADGILRIVRESAAPEGSKNPGYLILAETKISQDIREALVILAALPEPEGDLLFRAKVQDLANFKGGDRLFINLSDTNIRIRLGNTSVVVAPGRSNIYESPKLSGPANMPIMYEFFHPERKEWKILSASTVVIRPSRREISVFNSGSRIGKIRKHSILFPVPQQAP